MFNYVLLGKKVLVACKENILLKVRKDIFSEKDNALISRWIFTSAIDFSNNKKEK